MGHGSGCTKRNFDRYFEHSNTFSLSLLHITKRIKYIHIIIIISSVLHYTLRSLNSPEIYYVYFWIQFNWIRNKKLLLYNRWEKPKTMAERSYLQGRTILISFTKHIQWYTTPLFIRTQKDWEQFLAARAVTVEVSSKLFKY